jgi:hypothetical protein
VHRRGIVATNRFGFMTMTRMGAGWTMTAHDVRGASMTTCTLFAPGCLRAGA